MRIEKKNGFCTPTYNILLCLIVLIKQLFVTSKFLPAAIKITWYYEPVRTNEGELDWASLFAIS